MSSYDCTPTADGVSVFATTADSSEAALVTLHGLASGDQLCVLFPNWQVGGDRWLDFGVANPDGTTYAYQDSFVSANGSPEDSRYPNVTLTQNGTYTFYARGESGSINDMEFQFFKVPAPVTYDVMPTPGGVTVTVTLKGGQIAYVRCPVLSGEDANFGWSGYTFTHGYSSYDLFAPDDSYLWGASPVTSAPGSKDETFSMGGTAKLRVDGPWPGSVDITVTWLSGPMPTNVLDPSAIASAEAVGAPDLLSSHAILKPTSIGPTAAIGTPHLSGERIKPHGIASLAHVGKPSIIPNPVFPDGIPSAEGVGVPWLLAAGAARFIFPVEWADPEAIGEPSLVDAGPATIYPVGIG